MLVDAAWRCRFAACSGWFVDETDVKVSGVWRYVYWAVDDNGQVVDVYVSPKRDLTATFNGRHLIRTSGEIGSRIA